MIGCGLGDDAEVLAEAGYAVVAIDISETAICMMESKSEIMAIGWSTTLQEVNMRYFVCSPSQ